MLKILVCVKQVPDVDQMRMDPETGNLIRAGVPAILNPLDGNALAAALSVKEQYGAELSLITMGPPAAEAALRECLAAGADRAILVTDRAFGNADTLATSYSIVSAAKSIDSFDLIFCGKESLDGATGQMASQLAERFDASQLSCVLSIEDIDLDCRKVTALRELERGVERTRASLPCLITVEKANFRPRIPNLARWKASRTAEILSYNSRSIPGLDPAQIGDPGSPTKVPRTYPPEAGEPGMMIDEGSLDRSAAKLASLLAEAL